MTSPYRRFTPHAGRLSTLAALVSISLASSSASAQVEDPIILGEVTVRVAGAKELAQAVGLLGSQFAGVAVVDEIPGRNTFLLSYALAANQTPFDVETALLALQTSGVIVLGELNYGGQAAEGRTGSLWVSQVTIGPPEFATQYAVDLLGLPAAHARSTGRGTTIAILDTGIDASHPVLAGAVSPLSYSLVGDAPATIETADQIDSDGDGDQAEMFGHGTFVAGLVHLVAPDAKLVSVRVLDDDGHGDLFRIAKAMYWCIDNGIDVVNMSLGSTYRAFAMEEAAAEAAAKGIVIVGAAGNLDTDDPREYPACDANVFGVAALDRLDVKAPFSSFEEKLKLSAPGHSETLPGQPSLNDPAKSIVSIVPGGGFAAWRGTSMATAFVSGSVALVRAQHPAWPTPAVPASAFFTSIFDVLGASGVPVDAGNPDYKGQLGVARIDCAAATALAPAAPALGDLDGDGAIGPSDLSILLGAWGTCPVGPSLCLADLDGDGAVSSADLAVLLGVWN
jgi:subtilisin family serine protease